MKNKIMASIAIANLTNATDKASFSNYFQLANKLSNLLVKKGRKDTGYRLLLKSLARVRRSNHSLLEPKYRNNNVPVEQFRQKIEKTLDERSDATSLKDQRSKETSSDSNRDAKTQIFLSKAKILDPSFIHRLERYQSKLPRSSLSASRYLQSKQKKTPSKQNKSLNAYYSNKKKSLYKAACLCKLAIDLLKPSVETKRVRRGRVIYQVPFALNRQRQQGIAIRWLITSAIERRRSGDYKLATSFTNQLIDSLNKQGKSIEKRNSLQRVALDNRAYSHLRW